MAYLINGTKFPVVFLANPRTGSTSIRNAILGHGGKQIDEHHDCPEFIPAGHLLVHTVRHHCDVLVSYWYKAQRSVPFNDFVDSVLDGQNGWLWPNDFYNHWDHQPNYLLRYETLDHGWTELCLFAGLPDIKLERTKTKRPLDRTWQSLFTKELYEKVVNRYKEEMERYSYV